MCDGDDEEAVAVISDTGESVVPGQEGSQKTEDTAGFNETLHGRVGFNVGGREVSGTQTQKGEI